LRYLQSLKDRGGVEMRLTSAKVPPPLLEIYPFFTAETTEAGALIAGLPCKPVARRKPLGSTLTVGLIVAATLWLLGCAKNSPDTSASPPKPFAVENSQKPIRQGESAMPKILDPDPGQRAYDSEFLKLVANPPSPAGPELKPGWRKVTGTALRTGEKYEVTLDLAPQVLRLDVPEDRGYGETRGPQEAPLFPSFSAADVDASRFAPAAALALKAKQFDDGLYASVELAADAGVGRFPAKKHLLLRLLQALAAESDRSAAAILTAAARLGGQQPRVSAEVTREAETLQQEFLADELRSKPLGFYTWSEELSRIFQRDRMLQTEIKEQAARALAAGLSRDEELLRAYSAALSLSEKLTNPLAWSDLRELASALKEGHTPRFPKHLSLFPPSRAHETELIKKLYGDRPIPEGFNLADEMIKRIRAGTLDLKPTPTSGWYDYQTYALEALVLTDRMPEGKHLALEESYRKELEGLFKALLALTRETHVKQLEMPMAGAAAPSPALYISPNVTVEPLATYYLRRAHSYRFVRAVLEQAFGPEGLGQTRRLTAAGPLNLSLSAELRLMEALFYGAYLQSCKEIGMAPERDPRLGNSKGTSAEQALLGAWLASIRKDPDLGQDIRMMVPVFYDMGRKQIKVWAVLGVTTKPLTISYETRPAVVEIRGPDGKVVKPRDVEVEFHREYHRTAYFATAEIYVRRLLNRTEFRQHCDKYKTYKAIVSNLR
jgi:hypothetical protein